MYLLRFLLMGPPGAWWRGVLVTCIAGLGNVTLIGLVNAAAEQAALAQPPGVQQMFLFLIAFAVFYMADRMSLGQANGLLQERLADLRFRVAENVRRADLRRIEELGQGEIYATVVQETNHLGQNFPLLVSAAQGLLLLAFCLAYVATLSITAFLVVVAVMALGLLAFWLRRRSLNRDMMAVHASEAEMLGALAHYTEGFQEIRLNAARNDALHDNFTVIAEKLEARVTDIGRQWAMLLQFGNAFLYLLVGAVVLVLPHFFTGHTDIVYKLAVVAIFSVGPVTALTSVAPMFDKANIGLRHVFALEERLAGGGEAAAEPDPADIARFAAFRRITLSEIVFSYRREGGPSTFTVGPWTLGLRRGELLFLTGSNGSGKSTALKLITGLYEPDSGAVLVDDVAVTRDQRQAYRELFSTVFTDFHLFEQLYGIEDTDPARVNALIERFGLAGKVSFAEGRFSTHDLSTGQRKRLALIVALLEDRPVYVLDEWAADQDPEFREEFYRVILPELKSRGKTVIVVTHDDRFWNVADRLVRLDLGRIEPGAGASGETAEV
jgi:putative ATP-binding cassette transporter